MVVRVAIDVPALADQGRELDYLVPEPLRSRADVGTLVRVPLHGRRVAGWIVATDVTPPEGVRLVPLTGVTGAGPAPEVVELTEWAGWRWAGRRTALLRAASPPGAVRELPPAAAHGPPPIAPGPWAEAVRNGIAAERAVLRVPPATDPLEVVREVAAQRATLVVTPSVALSRDLGRGLRRLGIPVATLPEDWAHAAAGGRTVVGARGAAWAPAPRAGAVVVVDAHDEGLVEERSPSWSGWAVAAERARRLNVPCVLMSPCPNLEHLAWGQLVAPARDVERRGWARLDVHDRRESDPRAGLLGERLVATLRGATAAARVVVVLNRKGRARLLACRACGAMTVCEHCQGAMEQGAFRQGATEKSATEEGGLRCRRCGRARAAICQSCGSVALKALRSGVAKVREELEHLALLPVGAVTAEVGELPDAPILIGTEAVLHRVGTGSAGGGIRVGAVVFLDFDSELLAPRFRAAESALALLARASRVLGGRGGGRILVQTRLPDHPVLDAARRADPSLVSATESAIRHELNLPPVSALAEISGDPARTEALVSRLAGRTGIEVIGPTDGVWLVRAPDHAILCNALAHAGRPAGEPGTRLRVDVDPLRA